MQVDNHLSRSAVNLGWPRFNQDSRLKYRESDQGDSIPTQHCFKRDAISKKGNPGSLIVRVGACWTLVCILGAAICNSARGQQSEPQLPSTERVEFLVQESKRYADVVQFKSGETRAVLVFHFDFEGDEGPRGLDRLVIFCRGTDATGSMYEDLPNKRLVVTRPASEFSAFSRFQNETDGTIVYGIWEVAPNGDVGKFAIQAFRLRRPATSSDIPKLELEPAAK